MGDVVAANNTTPGHKYGVVNTGEKYSYDTYLVRGPGTFAIPCAVVRSV